MNTTEQETEKSKGRRNILTWIIGGLGTLLVATTVYPIVRFIQNPVKKVKKVNSAVVAKDIEIPSNKGKVVAFNDDKVLIININGEFIAMSAVCTHLGCIVQWKADEQLVWCACHNARYDTDGKKISGPQPLPLLSYKVANKNGDIVLYKSIA